MKKLTLLLALILMLFSNYARSQSSGSINVQGDFDKYYPVVFQDAEWSNNKATEVEIGRSNVHTDENWRGSVIAKIRFHTTDWGDGSEFIDVDIRDFNPLNGNQFIAGWVDATRGNSNSVIVVWLRGGATTYYYNSSTSGINPIVYDGVQHALPYQETNGPAYSYKTSLDGYVNYNGLSATGTAFYTGASNNYFAGNVGIGTQSPDEKLTVNGTIHAKEVKVNTSITPPDYVFEKTYDLKSLTEIQDYITKNKHLPEIPSAKEIERDGINLSEMNMKLLKKVEELTLYLIEKDSKDKEKDTKLQSQQEQINQLKEQLATLIKSLTKN